MTLTSKQRIGFIGLGTMGTPMATNLIKAGFSLVVWNRTTARMKPLVDIGAKAQKSPAHVAAESDICITMVSRPQDVEEVVLGESGVIEGIKPGCVFIDMSTVSPSTSRKIAGALAAKRCEFIDAPVVGSKGPATEASLVILAGGLPQTLERCRPVLQSMGRLIVHAGGVGMGSALKLATNLMLAHLMAGFAEGVKLLQASGVDPKKYLEVLQASTFNSPWYQTKGVSMLKGDFNTHFALKHMRKDLELMVDLAKESEADLPVTESVRALFARSQDSGKGELDYSAVFLQLTGNHNIL